MINELEEAIKKAMKEHDKEKLATLRMVKAGIKQAVIDEKKEENDELFISEVLKQIKSREESLTIFKEQNREDLSSKTEKELAILKEFLPKQLSLEEATKVIEDIIKELGATSIRDMGKVMKEVSSKLKGQFDLSKASSIIKEVLNK